MNIFDLFLRGKKVRCYPYCLGLKYDRNPGITKEQWEQADVNIIADVILKDLEKIKISAKIVDKTYIPTPKEKLIALKIGVMWMHGDYIHYADYHMVVKRSDGYWYSKFGTLSPEKLPLGIDIEEWNWRDSKNNVPENHYNSEIVYIAIK